MQCHVHRVKLSIYAHFCLFYFSRERVICQKADNRRSVWKFSAFILKITSKRNRKNAFFFLSAQKQIQKIITFYPFCDIAGDFNEVFPPKNLPFKFVTKSALGKRKSKSTGQVRS